MKLQKTNTDIKIPYKQYWSCEKTLWSNHSKFVDLSSREAYVEPVVICVSIFISLNQTTI